MNRLTNTQRTKIIKIYYIASYNALRDYGLHNRQTKQAIGKIEKKSEETGVVINIENACAFAIVSGATRMC